MATLKVERTLAVRGETALEIGRSPRRGRGTKAEVKRWNLGVEASEQESLAAVVLRRGGVRDIWGGLPRRFRLG